MLKKYLFILSYLWLFCFANTANATHMVGGEINYKCLGNNRYEIMVTVFRDCDTGVPWFDNPASVGVFDNHDSLIYDLRLTLRNNDTLDLNLTDPCLVAPPNVCIHTTTYIDTVTLPFYPGGYQIVYQRCCRNQDIVNIVNPTSSGATYSSFISEQALLNCNSSARFREWPPVYVCQNVAFHYDHSAFDIDGDSIVYELCTPFTGASPTQSMPQPPNSPPYNAVQWQSPYSANNMLGGPDSLRIDAQTGLLTGTPSFMGVFVVGICAKEYRNGLLISTTRRDFQYVVGVCGRLVSAAFFAPDIQCDNSLIVRFQNNSNSLGTGYVWSFGDSSNLTTSSLVSPTYIYPDTGHYQITLIADPGTLCSDTLVQDVYLQYQSIISDFDVTTASCTDSLHLDITDLTIDTISNIVDWFWDFGNGQTATIPYPSTIYDSSGTYIIKLRVRAANGCTATASDTLFMDLPAIASNDTLAICAGDTAVYLNPGGNPNHQYFWSPSIGLDSDTIANPLARLNGSQTYEVTVIASNGIDTCLLQRRITVIQSPPLLLNIVHDTLTCADTVLLVATANTSTRIEWSLDRNFTAIYLTNDSVYLPVVGSSKWYVRATNGQGCFMIDSVTVRENTAPTIANFSYQINRCDTVYSVQFSDLTAVSSTGHIIAWQWDFGDSHQSQLQQPSHQYRQTGNYTIQLEVTTEGNCKGVANQSISFDLPLLVGGDTLGICQGNTSVLLNPQGNPNLIYQWSPAASLNDSSLMNPLASPTVPTTYSVTITAINGLDTCIHVEQVHVNFPPPITLSAATTVFYCGNSVVLTASSPTAVDYIWAGDGSFNLILARGTPVTLRPQTVPYALYYVQAVDAYGCTISTSTLVRRNAPIRADFIYQSLGCSDSIRIQFTDITADTASSSIVSWHWTTSSGQSSNLQNPIFTFTQSQVETVRLVVTLANGCSGAFAQTIQLNLASLSGNTNIALCAGDSTVRLNPLGNSNLSYQWSPAAHLDNAQAVSPLATIPTSPFSYTVTVTGLTAGDTCRAVHQVNIRQAPPIIISLPKDTVICAGVFNMSVTTSSVVQTEWSFNPYFSPAILRNVSSFYVGLPLAPYNMYMYFRATDRYGCTLSDTASVFRRNIPIPVNFTTQILDCKDTLAVRFDNTSSFPSSLTLARWTWDYGNGQTANSYHGSHQYTGASPFAVTLTATATNGCTGQKTDTIFYDLPSLNMADTVGLCGADSVQLNIGGNPNLTYSWTPSIGLDNPNIASPKASPPSNTVYHVWVRAINNSDTCELQQAVLVGVDSFAFAAMPDTVICSSSVQLRAKTDVSTQVVWALDRNFRAIIGQTNPLTTYLHDARWFYAKGISALGCEAVDSVFVAYHSPDIALNFEMLSLNCGDSLEIQFNNLTQDSFVRSWAWDLGNGQYSSLRNPRATYYNNQNYTIQLKGAISSVCLDSTPKSLEIRIPKLQIVQQNPLVCLGDSTRLQIQGDSNLTYRWTPTVGLSDSTIYNPQIRPTTNQTYFVRVSAYSNLGGKIDTCWLEDSINVRVSPRPTVVLTGDTLSCDSLINLQASSNQTNNFEWSLRADFQNVINNTASWQNAQSNLEQWYFVRFRDDSTACTGLDSVVARWSKVQIDLDSIYHNCSGESIALKIRQQSNPSQGLQYNWSPVAWIQGGQGTDSVWLSPNNSGVLTAIVRNNKGCADTASTQIALVSPIVLQVSADTLVCAASLNLTVSSGQGLRYQWAVDADFNQLLGQQSSLGVTVQGDSTFYYVEAVDSFGCTIRDSVLVEYRPSQIGLDSVNLPCVGSTAEVVAINYNPKDSLTYSWSPSGIIQSGQGTDSLRVSPLVSTVVRLVVQNQYGCLAMDSAWVRVSNSRPLVAISASQDTVVKGALVQLQTMASMSYVYDWRADSSLSATNIAAPMARPQKTTIYYLTVTDAWGCKALDSIIIYTRSSTCGEPSIFVPSAFTPDGDGHNDGLVPRGNNITKMYFAVYNRWGQKVFETTEIGRAWDGTFRGKALAADVYGYYFSCECVDGNQFFKKGNITLIR